jgi:trypsin-like peptidase
MNRVTACCTLFLFCCMTAYAGAETPLPEDMAVLRAQPAVFMILMIGDIEVIYPKTVITKRINGLIHSPLYNDSLLETDYKHDIESGAIEATKNRVDYYWEKIVGNPGKYLEVGEKETQLLKKDLILGSGTGFAVDRQGILLTNAHVVSDTADTIPKRTPLIQQLIQNTINNLSSEFGGGPPEATKKQLIESLGDWFSNPDQSFIKGKFNQAGVVVKFGGLWEKLNLPPQTKPSISDLLSLSDQPLIVPAKVLAKGEPIPGEDVAVLRVGLEEGSGSGIDALYNRFKALMEIGDKLICLSLGDSDEVLPQTHIHALGFPGIGFNEWLMIPGAKYRASSEPGEIGQTKRMLGGWEAFEMSANTNHGDSGGPIIDDKKGNVIGLTVAGPLPKAPEQEAPAGHRLAVPINIARKYLKQAGIERLDQGPLTATWVEGLSLFSNGRYDEALKKFEEVYNMQKGDNPFGEKTSSYVSEMIDRCKKKLGLVP